MKHIIFSAFLIGVFLAGAPVFAQDHHHGTAHESAEGAKPIIEIMQGMNADLNRLTDAIVMENFQLITSAAHNIVNHPDINQEDLHNLFERLGPRKDAFIACDTAVHNLARDIAKAGEQENMGLVLEKYSAMLSKTVECHREYRIK